MTRVVQASPFTRRRAGILLHPTSLPGPFPFGDIGHAAYRFIEFLSAAGISVWQMLPLGPTHADRSPYQCLSTHACNPLLISIDWLADKSLLNTPFVPGETHSEDDRLKYLREAFALFSSDKDEELRASHEIFCAEQGAWLDDYALFMTIRELHGEQPWTQWPGQHRDRKKSALDRLGQQQSREIAFHKFCQFLFFIQWSELHEYARRHGVLLFGDLPIYVSLDSADVWANPKCFALDAQKQPKTVSGVPPDHFSETGQLWGNPQYDWQYMQKTGFSWWVDRVATSLDLFDLLRVDHFRAFQAYWEIPADAKTAIEGRWVKAPGRKLLETLRSRFRNLPLVAEDLGMITPEVHALRDLFGLPGMKILQFAFSGDPENIYLPHNHELSAVVYTGTHDNDTTLSWYEDLSGQERKYLHRYLANDTESMPWALIRCAMTSVAELAVVPMQDILELGKGNRMNTPGTTRGNWQWRFSWDGVPEDVPGRLAEIVTLYGR